MTEESVVEEKIESVTKADLVKTVQRETGLSSKGKAEAAIESVLNSIMECMKNGEDVNIVDFGSFRKIATAERQGRNPQTGEPLTIPAGFRIKFKPSKKLKELMNDDPTLDADV